MRYPSKAMPEACELGLLELPRYFARQLLTADELILEQQYFRQKMRLHNRLLWGWGTVCGTEVCRMPGDGANAEPDPWKVLVKPGYVLGPYGDDIVIGSEVTVDLRTSGVEGSACEEPEQTAPDPWCSRVCLPREPGPLYIAVRYRECKTRPVRVQPAGCGCEGEQCEYSRLRDSYEIGILDHCPKSHQGNPPRFVPCSGEIPACPPCPDEPWVVLAEVEIDANGIVGEPDNCSCRRIVLSLASFWCRCEPRDEQQPPRGTINTIDFLRADTGASVPGDLTRGSEFRVTMNGSGLADAFRVDLPEGFEVKEVKATGNRLTATVKVLDKAPAGAVRVRLLDASGHVVAEREDAFRVVETGGGTNTQAEEASPGRKGSSGRARRKGEGGDGG